MRSHQAHSLQRERPLHILRAGGPGSWDRPPPRPPRLLPGLIPLDASGDPRALVLMTV